VASRPVHPGTTIVLLFDDSGRSYQFQLPAADAREVERRLRNALVARAASPDAADAPSVPEAWWADPFLNVAVTFPDARYLAGTIGLPIEPGTEVRVSIVSPGVLVTPLAAPALRALIRWRDVERLELTGPDEVRHRASAGAVLLFGAAGLLLSRREASTLLFVHRRDGDAVLLEVRGPTPSEAAALLPASLGPVLR
jgi:hypothetical protein